MVSRPSISTSLAPGRQAAQQLFEQAFPERVITTLNTPGPGIATRPTISSDWLEQATGILGNTHRDFMPAIAMSGMPTSADARKAHNIELLHALSPRLYNGEQRVVAVNQVLNSVLPLSYHTDAWTPGENTDTRILTYDPARNRFIQQGGDLRIKDMKSGGESQITVTDPKNSVSVLFRDGVQPKGPQLTEHGTTPITYANNQTLSPGDLAESVRLPTSDAEYRYFSDMMSEMLPGRDKQREWISRRFGPQRVEKLNPSHDGLGQLSHRELDRLHYNLYDDLQNMAMKEPLNRIVRRPVYSYWLESPSIAQAGANHRRVVR
jgi:hypothetical protein